MSPGVRLMARLQLGTKLTALLAAMAWPLVTLAWAVAERPAQPTPWWASAAVGLLVFAYLALSLYLQLKGTLLRLQADIVAVAGGDLSRRVATEGKDELAHIGDAVESMNQRLSAMVADIRSSAARVGMSGQQVAGSSQSLAQRTEAQASSLQQTLAAVEQLSGAVTSNASAANELTQITEELRQQAESGGEAMRQSVASMGGLEASSRRVAEIIGTIDGIAFQTNILALNAAVEAARAGDSGRGFAVVASEVRQLAQRSAAAASEIRTLIVRSTEQVDRSVRQTREVGQTLDALVEGVRRVAESLHMISAASAQQSVDLEQVSQSVDNLDEITRHNAGMVDESAQASRELVGRAQALTSAVASTAPGQRRRSTRSGAARSDADTGPWPGWRQGRTAIKVHRLCRP
jgi:methyl-accepting chemotaxis protein